MNVEVFEQRWTHRVLETVDGAGWFCNECGWKGLNHYSESGALAEATRHWNETHADLGEDT